jgi:tetratricopeptide (TPR) repeat protein
MRSHVALLAALVGALACAHAPREFRCPAHGGRAWREVRTEHVVLKTDLDSGAAQGFARELETLHAIVVAALLDGPTPMPGSLQVVAFRAEEDFELFAPKQSAAVHAFLGGEPLVLMRGAPDGDRARAMQSWVAARQITQHVAARLYARQPRWFNRGLAAYMQTAGAKDAAGVPTVGAVPVELPSWVLPHLSGLRELLTPRRVLATHEQLSLSWALVHFLVDLHPRSFDALRARFARGEDPDAAWRAEFAQWDPGTPGGVESLTAALGAYVREGRFAGRHVHPVASLAARERAMRPSEVHDLRLSLALGNRGGSWVPARLAAEVEEALAEDPGNIGALMQAARFAGAQPELLARRATEAHPDDPRSWIFLAQVLPGGDDRGREEALRRALATSPFNTMALNDLAWTLLQTGRSAEALPLAREAVSLAPWIPAIVDTLAATLARLGRCAEAVAMQQRAIDQLADGFEPREHQAYLDHLADYQARCGTAPASLGR